jgi:predicted RNA-binding Zn-ribbon protein involved in translation (DUF1610 family)
MSHIKLKPCKARQIANYHTLDEMHKKYVKQFEDKKKRLPNKKKMLQRLINKLDKLDKKDPKLYTNKDIQIKSKLKNEIHELKAEIYDIENDVSEIDYYCRTEEILMDYYNLLEDNDVDIYTSNPELSEKKTKPKSDNNMDILDYLNKKNKSNKNNKKNTIKRRRKKKVIKNKGQDIRTFFGFDKTELDSNNSDNDKGNRAQYLDQYRTLIDNEYIPENKRDYNPIKNCNNCGAEKTLIQSEGNYVCESCGEVEMVIIESERPNYKEPIPDKPGYPLFFWRIIIIYIR